MNYNVIEENYNEHQGEKEEWTHQDIHDTYKVILCSVYLIFIPLAMWIAFLSVIAFHEFHQINSTLP